EEGAVEIVIAQRTRVGIRRGTQHKSVVFVKGFRPAAAGAGALLLLFLIAADDDRAGSCRAGDGAAVNAKGSGYGAPAGCGGYGQRQPVDPGDGKKSIRAVEIHHVIARAADGQVCIQDRAERGRRQPGPAPPAEAKPRLALLADRVTAYACLVASVRNTIMYQHIVDTAHIPQFGANPMDYDDNIIYDQRALAFRKVAREELDNINALIAVIEKNPGKDIIAHATRPDEESVFMLGADIVAALRHKVTTMLDHWQDYERLYPATKVWDYEASQEGAL
ncbi:MAG: hypothetical protein FWF84_08045, partial [Kiritimatiellaeota bacterium]|nr:hypothetical protein [Kiritimatiellota bacterium]